jgi:hypothetical protein
VTNRMPTEARPIRSRIPEFRRGLADLLSRVTLAINRRIGKLPTRLRQLASNHRWGLLLFALSLLLGILFLSTGYSPTGLSFTDLAAWPSLTLPRLLSYSIEPWRSANIPGQPVTGLGIPNQLTAMAVLQGLSGWLGVSPGDGQWLFLLGLLPISCVGFYLFVSLYVGKVSAIAASLLYGFNPFSLVALYGGGNPYGIIWFAAIPYILFFMARIFTRQSNEGRPLFWLCVAFLFLSMAGPEYPALTFGLFILPGTAVLSILYTRRWYVPAAKILGVSGSAVVLLSILLNLGPIGLFTPTQSQAAEFSAAISAGFPSGSNLLFYMIPTFGATNPSDPSVHFYNLVASNPLWILIATIFVGLLFFPYLSYRRVTERSPLALLPLALGGFAMFVDLVYAQGFSVVLFGALPEASILDSFIKLYPPVIVFCCASVGLLIDQLLEDIVPAVSESQYSPKRVGAILSFRRQRLARLPRSALTVTLAAALICSPIAIFAPYDFASITNQTAASTTVPTYLGEVASNLQAAQASLGLADGHTLWMPINGGSGMQNAIMAGDPGALFFPAAHFFNDQAFNSTAAAYSDLLWMIADGNGSSIGGLMADLDIATVVVLTVNYSENSGFNSTFGSVYGGPPSVVEQGFSGIKGDYSPILSFLKRQQDLREVLSTKYADFFQNLAWEGPVLSSQGGLLAPELNSIDCSLLSTLPGWDGPAPIPLSSPGPSQTAGLEVTSIPPGSSSATLRGQASTGPGIQLYDTTEIASMSHLPEVPESGSPSGSSVPFVVKALDLSGHNNTALGFGTPSVTGAGVEFANNSYFAIPLSHTRSIQTQTAYNFSLSVWVNSAVQHSEYQTVFSQGGGYQINSMGNYLQLSLRTTTMAHPDFFYVPYLPSTWYLLTIIRSGGSLYGFENATSLGEFNVSGPTMFLNVPYFIGSDGTYQNISHDRNWSGSITNLRLFSTPLSSSEVQALYLAGPIGNSSVDSRTIARYVLAGSGLSASTLVVSSARMGGSVTLGLIGQGKLSLSGPNINSVVNLSSEKWALMVLPPGSEEGLRIVGLNASLVAALLLYNITTGQLESKLHLSMDNVTALADSSYSARLESGAQFVYLLTTYEGAWSSSPSTAGGHFMAAGMNMFFENVSSPTVATFTFESTPYLAGAIVPYVLFLLIGCVAGFPSVSTRTWKYARVLWAKFKVVKS